MAPRHRSAPWRAPRYPEPLPDGSPFSSDVSAPHSSPSLPQPVKQIWGLSPTGPRRAPNLSHSLRTFLFNFWNMSWNLKPFEGNSLSFPLIILEKSEAGQESRRAPDLRALTHPGPWHTDLRQGSGLGACTWCSTCQRPWRRATRATAQETVLLTEAGPQPLQTSLARTCMPAGSRAAPS